MRFIGGGDFDERSLSCIAEVPQGALVWIMEGDARIRAGGDGRRLLATRSPRSTAVRRWA